MVRVISRVVLVATCMLAIAAFTQQASASGADFACTASSCGTVTSSGGNFSGSNISLTAISFNMPGFDVTDTEVGETFALAFDTSTSSISLSDADAATESVPFSTDITGTITAFSCHNTVTLAACAPGDASDSVALGVKWNIPGFGAGGGFVTFLVNSQNSVNSADLSVFPTPEPASLLLLGTGLLGLGGAVRRRWMN